MATGICYTWSGNTKKYESDTGTDNSIYVRRLLKNTYINNSISVSEVDSKNVTGLILTSFLIKDSTYISDPAGIILSTPPYSSYISHYLASPPTVDNYENYYLKGANEDTNESSYYTWEKINESQISNLSYGLIIASYYPKLGLNPAYYKYEKKGGTGYDLYCRVLYVNDNEYGSPGDNSNYNPNYSKFSDKFGININTYREEITYGKIYKDHKDGYFCGTFYSNKEDTGSDTIEATVKLESIIHGGQVNNGEVQFEFFLIPKGSNPTDYKNQPSIDGEISPTSEIIDNRIYNKGDKWGITKGIYAMEHAATGIEKDYYEQCSLDIGVRCNFHFACRNLNRDDLNNWALGDLSGIYTKVKNRYSTTIPYLKLNIIWDMNN